MKQRVITGAVLTVVLILAFLASNTFLFPLLCAVLSFFGAREVLRVYKLESVLGLSIPTGLFAAVLPMLAHLTAGESFLILDEQRAMAPLAYLAILLTAFVVYLFYVFIYGILTGGRHSFTSTLSAAMMVLYVTLGFLSLVLLRRMSGLPLAMLVFVGSWVSDTFAYFTGRLCGRHKLSPLVSPKKTVEGSIGGIVFSVLFALLIGWCLTKADIISQPSYIALALAGVLLSVASQVGDLAASLLKREYDVKDYGALFPGHGGVLDRFDSVIAVSVILLLFASLAGTSFSLLGAPVLWVR